MVTAGGSLPGRILTVAVSWPPRPSDTVNVAVNIPACVYVWLTLAPLACAEPSPKSQSYVSVSPSASVLSPPSNWTWSGTGPERGVASATASGLRFALPT